jgi:hypothetical protein
MVRARSSRSTSRGVLAFLAARLVAGTASVARKGVRAEPFHGDRRLARLGASLTRRRQLDVLVGTSIEGCICVSRVNQALTAAIARGPGAVPRAKAREPSGRGSSRPVA